MQVIKEFEYWEYNPGSKEKKYIGIKKIKEELRYPIIKFLNSERKLIDTSDWKNMGIFQMRFSDSYLTEKEMNFLAVTYDVELITKEKTLDGSFYLASTNEKLNKLYKNSAELTFIEHDNKEYLIIDFNRFENENQKNSRMWDYYGEPITYIHGIWEAPLLTDKIIEKIKNPNR